jgi:hypothetical protein
LKLALLFAALTVTVAVCVPADSSVLGVTVNELLPPAAMLPIGVGDKVNAEPLDNASVKVPVG